MRNTGTLLICNRCGEQSFIRHEFKEKFSLRFSGWRQVGSMDFCRDCSKKFDKNLEEFLTEGAKEETTNV